MASKINWRRTNKSKTVTKMAKTEKGIGRIIEEEAVMENGKIEAEESLEETEDRTRRILKTMKASSRSRISPSSIEEIEEIEVEEEEDGIEVKEEEEIDLIPPAREVERMKEVEEAVKIEAEVIDLRESKEIKSKASLRPKVSPMKKTHRTLRVMLAKIQTWNETERLWRMC